MFIKNSTLLNFTLVGSTDQDVKRNLHKRECNTDHEQPCHPPQVNSKTLGMGRSTLSSCNAEDVGSLVRIPIRVILTDLFACGPSQPLYSLLPQLESHLWIVPHHWTLHHLKESPISHPHLSCEMIKITPWSSSSCGSGCVHWFLTHIHLWTQSTLHNPTVSSDGYVLNDGMCNHHWSRHRDKRATLLHGPHLPCWW